jgi:thiamine biosynthesis lipoprotein
VQATGREDWRAWSCDTSVVVTAPDRAPEAAALVRDIIRAVDDACSRFRADSELMLLESSLAGGVAISPLLADLVRGALDCAVATDGDVDPTLGNDLIALGYDRDFSLLAAGRVDGPDVPNVLVRRALPGWERVRLDGSVLTVPEDLRLDLGASAKAIAADRAAAAVAGALECGALVSIGGDIATAGSEPIAGWEVLVQDTAADPAQQVSLRPGAAMATSSTQKRQWVARGVARHHILDPRLGLPAEVVWRSVTVASDTCLNANALSTASVVRGFRAVSWLDQRGVSARFVDVSGRIVTTGAWPAPSEHRLSTGVTA